MLKGLTFEAKWPYISPRLDLLQPANAKSVWRSGAQINFSQKEKRQGPFWDFVAF